MAKINWTEEAEFWLREIYYFLEEKNPKAASDTIDNIYERVDILRTFPLIGHKYSQTPERNIRILLYGHYRIGYLIKDDDNIDILGVFHGALDITKYLK